MSEPIEWVFQAGTSCAYCKDGLCQRMNQLMEEGLSQRKAADVMAEESGGRWTAANIKKLFQNWMSGENLPQPAKPKKKPKQKPELEGGDGVWADPLDEAADDAVEFAMLYARMAVNQLRSIADSHPDRDEAFDYVLRWINHHR